MNTTPRPPFIKPIVRMEPGEHISDFRHRRQIVWDKARADWLRESPMGQARDADGKPLYQINDSGHWWRTNPLKRSQRRKAMERDGNKCVKCGSTKHLEIDHIVRYIDGGTHDLDNLRTLCQPCHSGLGGQAGRA